MNTERIYVGGLSPAKGLTVSLVASRLLKVPNIEIVSINDQPVAHTLDDDINLGKAGNDKYSTIDEDGDYVDLRQFFYLEARYSRTATPETSSPPQQQSALETLAKQYNNTKWKGCTLRVESARPHFLKRLEAERLERTAREERNKQLLTAPTPSTVIPMHPNETHNAKPRRRLRIRKRFAEEAYAVDTHPKTISVAPNFSGWDSFASLHKRMQDKLSNQRVKLAQWRREERKNWTVNKSGNEKELSKGDELRGLVFLNRGIHVRFDGDPDSNATSSDSSEGSDDSVLQEEKKDVYAWSDDDTTKSRDSASLESVSTEDESEKDVATTEMKTSGYVWSDQESDEDDSVDENKSKKNRSFQTTNVLDEFSGGVDFDDTPAYNYLSEENNFVSFPMQMDDNDAHVQLEDDIRSNLDILSKLFPGEKISNVPKSGADGLAQLEADGTPKVKNDRAFGAGLIVQRYDPTKEDGGVGFLNSGVSRDRQESVDEKMEYQEPKVDVTNDESLVNKSASNDDEEGDDDSASVAGNTFERKVHEPNEPRDQIYEQDKLEDIFKQAREEQRQTSGFSFGALFESQIGDAATEQNASDKLKTTGFSFGGMFESQMGDSAIKPSNDTPHPTDVRQYDNSFKQVPIKPQRKTRVGLRFPSNILDEYESQFFSMNEGSRIIADMESMRNDEGIQERWQKEREVLTLDWKRKQKNAVSRKVKKVRRY